MKGGSLRHVMLDIEALGTCPDGLILSIGACEFTKDGVGNDFYRRIDLASSLLAGFTVDADTVKWWRQQSTEAIHMAFHCQGAVPIRDGLEQLARFLSEREVRVWAKGPDYDCAMLRSAYNRLAMKVPWSFRNTRDVRTVFALDVGGVLTVNEIHPHIANVDAHYQAEHVIRILKHFGIPLN